MGDQDVDLDLGNYMDVKWTGLRFSAWVGLCSNVQLWGPCER
jgi:hypothetical protein